MIDASTLYVGARVLIKTQEQFPISSEWLEGGKRILGKVVTISSFDDLFFKAEGFSYYFPLSVISSIMHDEYHVINTDSINAFIDLI